MKRRSNARLFECDGYTFKCWIDPNDARARYEQGELDVVTHPVSGAITGFRLLESFESSLANRIPPNQSSISLAEMLLNVGLTTRKDDFASRGAIQAAQTKIHYWPFVIDRRAPLVAVKV